MLKCLATVISKKNRIRYKSGKQRKLDNILAKGEKKMSSLNKLFFHVFKSIEFTSSPIDNEDNISFIRLFETAKAPI